MLKRLTTTLTLIAALCAGAIVTAQPVFAGNIILRSAGAEDPATNNAARNVNTGTNHKYVTVDFPTGATETCTLFHFGLFTDYTSLQDIAGSLWYIKSGTSTTNMQVRMDIQCVAPTSENYDTVGYANGTAFTFTPPATANLMSSASVVTATLDETTAGCNSATPVILRVCRTANDGGTPNPDTLKLVQLRLTY